MPKGYWIVDLDITDRDAFFRDYAGAVWAFLRDYDARFLVRAGARETPEGKGRAVAVVIEFPSYDAALTAYKSEAYGALKALRMSSSSADFTVVEGYEGPQPGDAE